MTREDMCRVARMSLGVCDCLCLELATGFGKTRIALSCANAVCAALRERGKRASVLILVAKTVHKDEWRREIAKWGGLMADDVVIECYESLRKHAGERYSVILSDEGHHLSEARREVLAGMSFVKLVLLSATMPMGLKDWLRGRWRVNVLSVGLPEAIRDDVLPEPVICLLPLSFDDGVTETITRNGGKGLPVVECPWERRWDFMRRKDVEVRVRCAKRQYLDDLDSSIGWFRDKSLSGHGWARFRWLRLCKDRLEWLSSLKNPLLLSLLSRLDGVRAITFCSTIGQAESLGEHCVHSGNGLSGKVLDAFNRGDVNHVTAVNILNEGCNLVDCQVGIFANVTSSEIITRQRSGRLLRHPHPVMIMPYWAGTREEELIKKHLEDYDKELIKVIDGVGVDGPWDWLDSLISEGNDTIQE